MFHAVPGKILNSDDLKCGEKIEMFNGDSSRTKCINSAMYQNGAGNTQLMSSPQIIQTDIKFCTFLSKVPAFAFVFSIGTLSIDISFLSLSISNFYFFLLLLSLHCRQWSCSRCRRSNVPQIWLILRTLFPFGRHSISQYCFTISPDYRIQITIKKKYHTITTHTVCRLSIYTYKSGK